MKPTEKDIVIEKIKEMPAEEVAKVLIFIAGMEAGNEIFSKTGKQPEVKNNPILSDIL